MSENTLTIAQRVKNLSKDQYITFYRYLLRQLEISRHSSPEFQVKGALTTNAEVIEYILDQVERE